MRSFAVEPVVRNQGPHHRLQLQGVQAGGPDMKTNTDADVITLLDCINKLRCAVVERGIRCDRPVFGRIYQVVLPYVAEWDCPTAELVSNRLNAIPCASMSALRNAPPAREQCRSLSLRRTQEAGVGRTTAADC